MRNAHKRATTEARMLTQGRRMGASSATKKVIVEFPTELLQRAEETASQMSTDRSKLIRFAVEVFVNRSEKQRFEQELAEGYAANDDANRRIRREFAHLDADGV